LKSTIIYRPDLISGRILWFFAPFCSFASTFIPIKEPELSGSEFFGHEPGAFTGADRARDGAFALADEGSARYRSRY